MCFPMYSCVLELLPQKLGLHCTMRRETLDQGDALFRSNAKISEDVVELNIS